MNILIAEDSPVIQVIHRELMHCWGYDFDIASNGIEAVSLAQKNNGKYNFCLMDIEMPKMNGIEAARIIRKTVEYFPIMALTSNDDCESECYGAGMDGFALKPCFHEDLLEKIKKLSVKIYKLITKRNGLDIIEVMPVDRQHAEELRELANKNLCKMILFENPSRALIVHKNIMNKISHDFNVKGQLLTTFINRDEDKPALCHLFKESNNLLPQTLITEDEYASILANEDQELDNYPELSLKAEDV
ncbi:MAG: response regulator [Candidatus Thiodiazotropha sp. (ex Epidulcina cf. delphinae)]|nr:response regulator [Candidatus Thiodiazotropha sp. (ex Epidulcina cf. delphinae)]